MPLQLVPLAHAGEGATWQALVVTVTAGVAIVFLLTLLGRLTIESGDDLVLPLAAVAIVSSIAPAASATLSDQVGWALPAGGVLLLALLVHAFTDLDLDVASWVPWTAMGLAVVLAVGLQAPLTRALHPPEQLLPLRDDAAIEIVAPADGTTVPAGEVAVEVAVEGGSIGAEQVAPDEAPDDPEERGQVRVFVDSRLVAADPTEDCAPDPCRRATYPVDLEPGEHRITAELRTAAGLPLAPAVITRVTVTAE